MAELFSSIGSLQSGLDYHLERHNLLAANLAHIDTPGYRPVDLARVEPFSGVLKVALSRTSELHQGTQVATPAVGRVFEDLSAGTGNDGNYVSLDREAAKLAANHLRYDVISSIAATSLRQLAFAANDAKG